MNTENTHADDQTLKNYLLEKEKTMLADRNKRIAECMTTIHNWVNLFSDKDLLDRYTSPEQKVITLTVNSDIPSTERGIRNLLFDNFSDVRQCIFDVGKHMSMSDRQSILRQDILWGISNWNEDYKLGKVYVRISKHFE